MSDESRVYLKKEGRVFRWGEIAYFKSWNGLKETVNLSRLRMLAFPVAVAAAIFVFVTSNKKEVADAVGLSIPPVGLPDAAISVPIREKTELSDSSRNVGKANPNAGRIRVLDLQGAFDIPVGTEAGAVLESGATDGIVKARLSNPLLVDGEPVIPSGATIVGRGKSSEERLYVEFNKAILAGGRVISFRAQAFDSDDKILGLKGALVGRRTKKMAMAVGFGVLGGATDALQETSGTSIFGGQRRSVRDAALAGASKAALDQSQVYLEEMKNARPVIEVKTGTAFYLIIDEPKRKEE